MFIFTHVFVDAFRDTHFDMMNAFFLFQAKFPVALIYFEMLNSQFK